MSTLLSRLRNFERRITTAAERYGISRRALLLRLAELYRRSGFRPSDAIILGLADPRVSDDEVAACFTKAELLKIQERLNPPSGIYLTEDKDLFYPHCEALGISVPQSLGLIGRGAPTTREDWLQRVVGGLPQTFITKPAAGVYGEGVNAWTRVTGGFADHHQRVVSPSQLFDLLHADAKYDRFIVQQRLQNHATIVGLTRCESLQTVRIATLIDSSGKAHTLYAEWKLVIGNNVTDNYMFGRSGNLTANINLKTGVLGPAKNASPDGVGRMSIPRHPVTGLEFEGFVLPDWNALTELALRCATLFKPLRTVGWDIGLTPRGPVVIEGNTSWDPANEAVIGEGAPGVGRPGLGHDQGQDQGHEMIEGARLLRLAARELGA